MPSLSLAGIAYTDDKLLQTRECYGYGYGLGSQRSQLGVLFASIGLVATVTGV